MHSIPGFNALLIGATGSGKTHSLRTLLDAGLEVFVLFTEPGMEVLGDLACEQNLHYHYIPPANADWDTMIDSAKKINTLNFEALSKLPAINKQKYNQLIQVLESLHNFPCDRCGETFGDVSTWDTNRVLVIDSLSGLNIMSMDLVVGSKPTKSMSDWGVAQSNLERLINKLCTDTQCHFVLTGHLEKEHDEVTGRTTLMVSTLGRKLAPVLPRFFSDVILAKRDGEKFTWSTAAMNTDLKARNLPIADNLQPDFKQILATWVDHGGEVKAEPTAKTANTAT